MKVHVTRRKTCRLCESRNLAAVVTLKPTPVAEKYVTADLLDQEDPTYPLELYMCADCGHVQLLDVIDPEFIYDGYTYQSSASGGLVKHFDECAASICTRHAIESGSLIIDIGSNDGGMLRCFQKRGHRVLGIDPAREIAQLATESGVETIPEFLTTKLAGDIANSRGRASVVTAFNVFAHADDMSGFIESVRLLLADDGVFVFEASYLLDIIDHALVGTIFHEHLSYHSLKPLMTFFSKHNMELIDVERVTIQGGSIVGAVQHSGGPRAVSAAVRELADLETRRKLDQVDTLTSFGMTLQTLFKNVEDRIRRLHEDGKTIAGFGAARSGTTLIAQMNLGDLLSYIVDDHPDKVNKFNPGQHLPVLPTRTILEKKPDYVFILAWIHAKRIIESNKQYLEQGGRFIVCFPDVQIIGPGNQSKG